MHSNNHLKSRAEQSIGTTRHLASTLNMTDVGYSDWTNIDKGRYKKTETMGVIASAVAVNNTLFAICAHINQKEGISYFGVKGDLDTQMIYELYYPVLNIDLSISPVDPRSFIGKNVLVTEVNDNPVKVEYIGEVGELNASVLGIPRVVLRSFRNFIGGYESYSTGGEVIRDMVSQYGYSLDQLTELSSHSLNDVLGKVVLFDNEGYHFQDTESTPDGYIKIKKPDDLVPLANNQKMKTRKCHLPIMIFSGK